MRPMIGSSHSGRSAPNAQRGDAERDDHQPVPERVERPEPDGVELFAPESRGRRHAAAQRRGECRGARPGVVGVHLERAAVAVVVAADRSMLLFVRGLGDAGRGGRAGDVGDRRDVIPVDPVTDAEGEARDQHADAGGCRDGGRDIEHASFLTAGRIAYREKRHIATSCICSGWRLSTYTSHDARDGITS